MTLPTDSTGPDALYRAIGRMVVAFAWLEENLHDAITVAMQECDTQKVNVLTAGLQFRTLVEKIGTLCHISPSTRCTEEEVQAYCANLLKLNDERNRLIHSVYGRAAGGAHTAFKRAAKPKTGFTLNVRSVSITQIDEFTKQLQGAEKRLWDLVP